MAPDRGEIVGSEGKEEEGEEKGRGEERMCEIQECCLVVG